MRRLGWTVGIVLACLAAGQGQAAAPAKAVRPPIVEIYSDVCWSPQSGDLVGRYVMIMRMQSYDKDPQLYAILKYADSSEPEVLALEINGSALNIYALDDSPTETSVLRGTISAREIVAKSSSDGEVVHLRRIPNLLTPQHDCKPG